MRYRLTRRGKILVSSCFVIFFTLILLPFLPEKSKPQDLPENQQAPLVDKNYLNRVILTVYFEPDQSVLTEESCLQLDVFARIIPILNSFSICLKGYSATTTGENSFIHMALSRERAETVKNYLLEQGIRQDIIFLEALGAQMPVGSNETEEGRALNRRVDIYLMWPEPPEG